MNQTIIKAIQEKRLLSFNYQDTFRTVEPHLYGLDHEGEAELLAYQIAGDKNSGDLGWKMLKVEKMRDITAEKASFTAARPDFKEKDKRMAEIWVELENV